MNRVTDIILNTSSTSAAVVEGASGACSGGVTVNDRDNGNCTALHWAAINNHLMVAKFLVDQGAVVDGKSRVEWTERA